MMQLELFGWHQLTAGEILPHFDVMPASVQSKLTILDHIINQEFNFTHPSCKIRLNQIYNCHFLGCQTWDPFSQGIEKFYSTYNRSLKVMADLPIATHRYLLESVSEQQHMSTTLVRNFLKFVTSIKKSSKPVLKQLFAIAKSDVRTITGSNLRNILLQTNLLNVKELHPGTANQIKYKEILDKWTVPIIRDIIDMKCGDMDPPEGCTIRDLVCTG